MEITDPDDGGTTSITFDSASSGQAADDFVFDDNGNHQPFRSFIGIIFLRYIARNQFYSI